MKHFAFSISIGLISLAISGCNTVGDNSSLATSPDAPSFKATAEADREARQTDSSITPYPFRTCAVQFHKPFKDGKPKHRRVYKGQEVLFCCTPCVKAFDMNPEPYMPRILAAANSQ
ncbi:MAG: hypothetical protein P1U58_04350 [Verrucomicrobiales bacterium]|nr:hypothetical protein [Verrucomicrobiales bacterium]